MIAYGEPLRETQCDQPSPAGTEVLVRVSHCGVCHSDLHLQDGYFELGEGKQLDVRSGRDLPFTLGHEIAGVIEQFGPDAEDAAEGRRVVVYPWIGCGACALCQAGEEHLCNAPKALGITVDGGFATHVLVPHPRYLLDAEGIGPDIAGSYMCSGLTAYSALKKVERHGRSGAIMIVGLGGVGMMSLQFARALFKAPVMGADIDPSKRKAASEAGAAEVFDPGETDARKAVLGATGEGVAAAIDFVGTEQSLRFAQSVVAKGGLVVVVGLMGGTFSIPAAMLPLRAITVSGSYVGSLREARDMLELIRTGSVSAIPIQTRTLNEANMCLDELRAGNVIGRLVLTP